MAAPKTSDGRPRVALAKDDTSKVTLYSHDWTDPTTWTQESIRVVDEVATCTNAPTYTIYSLAHVNVIDTYHGKVTQEDFLVDSNGNSYRVGVKVNGAAQTEQDPHFGSGGDFTLDYENGTITFLSALQESDVVTCTYHYATSSIFTIKPEDGKILRINTVDVQFSDDVVITDSVVFQPYGYVNVFAPQYCTTNGGPYPPGTKIPLGNPVVYKTITDYQNDAVKAYPQYSALGGNSWRGAEHGIIVFNWDYLAQTPLPSSLGMEVRISLQHDTPFGGWYGTATFYCTTEDE